MAAPTGEYEFKGEEPTSRASIDLTTDGAKSGASGAGGSDDDDDGWKIADTYRMESGRALVLHWDAFDGTAPARPAAHIDSRNLSLALERLRFEVSHGDGYMNLSSKETMEMLQAVADEDYRFTDALMIVINSHGKTGKFMCSDEQCIPILDIVKLFSDEKVPTLAGKPRIFIMHVEIGQVGKEFVLADKTAQSDTSIFGVEPWDVPDHCLVSLVAPPSAFASKELKADGSHFFFEFVSMLNSGAGRNPFPDLIERANRRAFKRYREQGTIQRRRVGFHHSLKLIFQLKAGTPPGSFITMWNGHEVHGKLTRPKRIALTPPAKDGTQFVVVADTDNHRIQVYTPDGKFVRQWGSRGKDKGWLSQPGGVAVTSDGAQVVVADTGNHRVCVFDFETTAFVHCFGSEGNGLGQFYRPSDVAITPTGCIIVSDTGNHRLQLYEADGEFMRIFGGLGSEPGLLNQPMGLCFTPDNALVVCDSQNHRIQLMSMDWDVIGVCGHRGARPGEFIQPVACAVCPLTKRIHVVSSHKVQVFSPNGKSLVRTWGEEGRGKSQFWYPAGVAVMADGRVLVAESSNGRVQMFTA